VVPERGGKGFAKSCNVVAESDRFGRGGRRGVVKKQSRRMGGDVHTRGTNSRNVICYQNSTADRVTVRLAGQGWRKNRRNVGHRGG